MAHHALTVLLPVCTLAACAAGPPLPPPPAADLRAQWRVVELEVSPVDSVDLEVDGPPTTFFGRMAVGTSYGFLVGAVVGGAYAGPAVPFGVALGAATGGCCGFVLGPFCGESSAMVDATTARLVASTHALPPSELLGMDLRRALAVRGTVVVDHADVRCVVRLSRWSLCGGQPHFDPRLAPLLTGELTMRRRSDGEVLHTLPIEWQGPSRRFSAWGERPSEVAAMLRAASAEIATFLADELLCTVDIAWGGADE